jgi:F420-dependent methylenetetrahydromethanopterin dehydrogenase
MHDPATTANPNDEAAQFLRESGVLRAMQRDAMDINLRDVANGQGFELLHISHRHHPVVEFSVYMGNQHEHHNTVRLRYEVCRLLRAASVRVSASNVFARYRRAVVRVACVPDWD